MRLDRLLFAACLIPAVLFGAAEKPSLKTPTELPVRALMLAAPPPGAFESFVTFVREDLPREGVNTLIFRIDYNYQYKSRPELASRSAYTEPQIKTLVRACREAGVKLIPLVNCLGHQSWARNTFQLLTTYPQFDETPGLYPENKDIYCRSYCPNHPDVHKVIFDLLGEIAEVCETDAVHVGMDEVFLIGEDACPRCRGKDKAELFAQEVRTLRDFLASKRLKLWMWGDRLIDGRTTGLGEWEGAFNHTERAVDLVPKDIVICDWHYNSAPPTPEYFAVKGFEVVICSWNKPAVGVAQAEAMVRARVNNRQNPKLAGRFLGVMATNWSNSGQFLASYGAAQASGGKADNPAVDNFIALFARVRELKAEPVPQSAPAPKPTTPPTTP